MSDKLQSFLDQSFHGLELAPPLFYSWESGLRFEIANPKLSYTEPGYLAQAFERSKSLFDAVFDVEDEILFVADIATWRHSPFIHKKPINIYRKYIRQANALYDLKLQVLETTEEEDDEIATFRFSYACRKKDIRYPQLLQAICYEDFGHPSTILKNQKGSSCQIYFVNLSKKLIYHLYDDRGCDIIAADKDEMEYLYEKYNDWILDYDREKIDALFK